jgi:hypothetical protein
MLLWVAMMKKTKKATDLAVSTDHPPEEMAKA